jgi:hypothetical protein
MKNRVRSSGIALLLGIGFGIGFGIGGTLCAESIKVLSSEEEPTKLKTDRKEKEFIFKDGSKIIVGNGVILGQNKEGTKTQYQDIMIASGEKQLTPTPEKTKGKVSDEEIVTTNHDGQVVRINRDQQRKELEAFIKMLKEDKTINAQISITANPGAMNGGHIAGHCFVKISAAGKEIRAGYYPKESLGSTGDTLARMDGPGIVTLGFDKAEKNSVTLTKEISAEKAVEALELIQKVESKPGQYTVLTPGRGYHCATFAQQVLKKATGIKLPWGRLPKTGNKWVDKPLAPVKAVGELLGRNAPDVIRDSILRAGGSINPTGE